MPSTSDTTALIPAVAAVAPSIPAHEVPTIRPSSDPSDPREQAEHARLRSDLLRMAHMLTHDPTLGGEGSLTAGEQEVDIARLWRPDRFDPIRYTEEEIASRAEALVAASYVIDEPLIVVKAVNPAPVGRGMKRADLMIVANSLTWEAATRLTSVTALRVAVREKMSLFHAMTSIAQGFTLHHHATPLETGRLILRLILSDIITRQEQPDLELPPLTQKRLAQLIGVSQETVSHYAGLAMEDDDLIDRVDAGELPVGHAMALRYAPAETREPLIARVVEREQAGAPMTRDEVREEVRGAREQAGLGPQRGPSQSQPRKKAAQPWMGQEIIRPPKREELLFQDVFDFTPPEIFCAHLHDAYVFGRQFRAALQSAGKKEPKTLSHFMALMEDPDLVAERDSYVQSMLERMMAQSRGDE